MPAPPCATELAKLYNAVMELQSGKRATTISFGDRSATYAQGQLQELLQLYRVFYRQCGATEGYPDLANPIERGPPMRIRMFK